MSNEQLKNRILELEIQRFIDMPHSGFKKSVSARSPALISLVRSEFAVTDEGDIVNKNVGNDNLSLTQFFKDGVPNGDYFYDERFLEAKIIKAEMKMYPNSALKAMTEDELWDKATEIAEQRRNKQGGPHNGCI